MGPAEQFRAGVEGGDIEAAIAVLADDVVFHSPVVFAPYQGRDAVAMVLRGVAHVFSDFRYTAQYDADGGHVLRFECRVGDRELEGVDIITTDGSAITQLTVLVRPYSAATALREQMAALLASN